MGRIVFLLGLGAFASTILAQTTGIFMPTGSMVQAREGHTATLLQDGRVLITGGYGASAGMVQPVLSSAEIFDPRTGTFSATGSMLSPRAGHTATLLPDGRVLVVGGWIGSVGVASSAELYDPSTGTFTITGTLAVAGQTATLLNNGKVLITGGFPDFSSPSPLLPPHLYDPSTNSFSIAGEYALVEGENWSWFEDSTAVLLSDGRVLVTAGAGIANVYDPDTSTFYRTGSPKKPLEHRIATLLANGMVLLTGGDDGCGFLPPDNSELYNPATGTFTPTITSAIPRDGHTAIRLLDGTVLITGGYADEVCEGDYCTLPLYFVDETNIYDPSSQSFLPGGTLITLRRQHDATLLPDGRVLITGGLASGFAGTNVTLASAEIYTASASNSSSGPVLPLLPGATNSQGMIYHSGTNVVASAGAPAAFGETILIPFGAVSMDSSVPPQVIIGGHFARQVAFSDTAGPTGPRAVTAVVPSGITPDPNVPVWLFYQGQTSNSVTIAVTPDPWQEASTVMTASARSNSLNFLQWAQFWQNAPGFSYAPPGFGVPGSIDSTLLGKIIAVGGGDGSKTVTADQWLTYNRAVVPDPWQQAAAALVAIAGTPLLNFDQWSWFWQRAPAFPNAPTGFGVPGFIDNYPGLNQKIIALGGGDGLRVVSAGEWVNDYRAFLPDPWQQAGSAMAAFAGMDSLNSWQWAWYWQRTPAFPNAPAGFGMVGSISPDVMDQIMAGGGDPLQSVSAEQWIGLYRAAADTWQQAATILATTVGGDKLNFWQWAWYWQRSRAFPYAPPGFGILGSIDSLSSDLDAQIIAAGGGDGAQAFSARQWVEAYRIAWSTSSP